MSFLLAKNFGLNRHPHALEHLSSSPRSNPQKFHVRVCNGNNVNFLRTMVHQPQCQFKFMFASTKQVLHIGYPCLSGTPVP